MKNFLICLLLTVIFISCAYAQENIKAPIWDEFCPPKYLNVEKSKGIKDFLIYDELNDYWFERRQEFEQQIEACQIAPDIDYCYKQIRINEIAKNKKFEMQQEQEKKEIETEQIYQRIQQPNTFNIIGPMSMPR